MSKTFRWALLALAVYALVSLAVAWQTSHASASGAGGAVHPAQVVDTPTATDTPTNTPIAPTATPTDTPTNTPIAPTATPTDTPTNTPIAPTATPTDTPTNTPIAPTATPTDTPTNTPIAPTATPTNTPTNTPIAPTATPTNTPTYTPTPTNTPFPFRGFFQPVDNPPAVNQMKAGRAVPIKFSLGGNLGINVLAPGYPQSQPIACPPNAAIAPAEETTTAGKSTLTYDSGKQQYVYIWKTEKSWAGTCRQFTLRLLDGYDHIAYFNFVR